LCSEERHFAKIFKEESLCSVVFSRVASEERLLNILGEVPSQQVKLTPRFLEKMMGRWYLLDREKALELKYVSCPKQYQIAAFVFYARKEAERVKKRLSWNLE